jgi:hypothetical protein
VFSIGRSCLGPARPGRRRPGSGSGSRRRRAARPARYGVTQTWWFTKPARLRHQAFFEAKGKRVVAGQELVADRLADGVQTPG